jgi:Protein of unknown function (DUF3667)/Domain of unknown function (DUF4286)
VPGNLIYEVECQLDPDIVADYDAWLPGHIRDVLSCAGFLGATIEYPETPPGERQRRHIRYRIESVAALDQYLENQATRLRTETAQRFGGRVQCERRVLKPRHDLTPSALEAPRCLNCGTPVSGNHCAECGQSSDVHVLSMKEVAGDVTHSLLHLDSRAWRTLRLLTLRPGALTREFIAGRHQMYLPPFRLYLAISILFFALSALLPDSDFFDTDDEGTKVTVASPENAKALAEEIRKEMEADGVDLAKIDKAVAGNSDCNFQVFDAEQFDDLELALGRACKKMRADGGAHFAERFAATAPKLMFLFLPVIAAVALLFYWRPRRLYTEHLVLLLHNHAFTFLLIGATEILSTIADLKIPFVGILGFGIFALFIYLPYYVFRSMRVVYGEGRLKTMLKFLALGVIYFLLLGITMLSGLVYAMLTLS